MLQIWAENTAVDQKEYRTKPLHSYPIIIIRALFRGPAS